MIKKLVKIIIVTAVTNTHLRVQSIILVTTGQDNCLVGKRIKEKAQKR